MTEQQVIIDALKLDDNTILLLGLARLHGFLDQYPALETLAEGGAQAIYTAGRDFMAELFPHGHFFEITQADKDAMDRILASPELLSRLEG